MNRKRGETMGVNLESVKSVNTKANVHVKPKKKLLKQILSRYDLYLMLLLPMIWYIIFQYGPMYGLQIAFKEYVPIKGFLGSEWVGFDHFERFFSSYYFGRLLWN